MSIFDIFLPDINDEVYDYNYRVGDFLSQPIRPFF